MRRFIHNTPGILVVASLLMHTAKAEDLPCPPATTGVHETRQHDSVVYTAVARIIPLSQEEESCQLAEAEARLNAKKLLLQRLSPDMKSMNFKGLIELAMCRIGGAVFATLRLDEANARRALEVQKQIDDSVQNSPTPQ